ncbi:hypothetical protein Tsubulata_037205 [Turnera subulata]|uniref:rRNA N-glycosylase n=1 Tax=Turnera subulata TaxID=218843 RepID=A0A9Q0JEY3_9ROSI|nr:hypothetical protein Tsubulata_037205 [Turnera subulata]
MVFRRFTLNTECVDEDIYRSLIEAIRDAVASQFDFQGIRILREPGTLPDNRRFLLVTLINEDNYDITVAIDRINLYVVGYQCSDLCFFFMENDPHAAPYRALFPEIRGQCRTPLPFGGNYTGDHQLNSLAGNRAHIHLGMRALSDAIRWLSTRGQVREADLQVSFVVIIQMLSEAARFRYIEQRVVDSITGRAPRSFLPDGRMLSLENHWTDLRDVMVQADSSGNFPPLKLQDHNYRDHHVSSVTFNVFADVALIKFARFRNAGLLSVSRRNRGHGHSDDDDDDANRPTSSGQALERDRQRARNQQNQGPSTSRRNNNNQGRHSGNQGPTTSGRNNPRRREEL